MLTKIDLKNLNPWQIVIITMIVLLLVIMVVLIGFLVLLSSYRNKQFVAFKNLQYIQSINIKERLNRIKKMAHTNKQYNNILGIWISRYHFFLTTNLENLFKNYLEVVKLQNKKELWKAYQCLNKVYQKSNILKYHCQLLTTEIDYFISIDQLLREYQLFFKQNFNYLQAETVKINLQNNLNEEQLNEVIKIINEMFQTLETNINEANFSQIITILSEIALAIVTLAEILANLPNLRYVVTNKIQQKMHFLQSKCEKVQIDKTLVLQYQNLANDINAKLEVINTQINNLQYKKAKTQTEAVLKSIMLFENKINNEQNFYVMFKQCYERYLVFNFNFNDIFNDLRNQITQLIKNSNEVTADTKKIIALEAIITKQLAVFNHFDNLLIVETQKVVKTTSYQILLMLLKDLFENSIIVFTSLNEYNKLLLELSKPKLRFKIYLNKINSMMLQIDNILNNINFYFLLANYQKKFTDLQYLINETILNFKNDEYNDKIFDEFSSLQNKIFQLYTEIKMEISIHNLSHLTLVYANRYRRINEQLTDKFNEIEKNINDNHYQEALTLLLELMQ